MLNYNKSPDDLELEGYNYNILIEEKVLIDGNY